MRRLTRRDLMILAGTLSAIGALQACAPSSGPGTQPAGRKDEPSKAAPAAKSGGKKTIIAEPVHSIIYLPMYAALHEGHYAKEGLQVEIITTGGGGNQLTAMIAGEAWTAIVSPDVTAQAVAQGKNVKDVVAIAVKAPMYLVPAKDVKPTGDLKTDLKGKKIAVGPVGGTPNSILRYHVNKLGLKAASDVTLAEMGYAGQVPAAASKQVDYSLDFDPSLSTGIAQGAYGQPVFNYTTLGDFAWTDLAVMGTTLQNDLDTGVGFVRALVQGLKAVRDKAIALRVAKKEFGNLSEEILTAAIDRAIKDEHWSKDGAITPASVDLVLTIMKEAGVLKTDTKYDDVIDMTFVKKAG